MWSWFKNDDLCSPEVSLILQNMISISKCILFRYMNLYYNSTNCMPLILKTIRDLSQTKSNYPICNKTSNLDPVIEYNKFAMLINKCQKPCNTVEYKGDVKKHEGWRAVKGLEVSMYFPSNEIKVQEEYLLYHLVDLVGIIGGNMGLFLGFSFFEFVKIFFSKLNNYFLN